MPFLHDPAERLGGVSIDNHLEIVHRRIWLAVRIEAAGIVNQVLGRIPALHRQVDAADECELLVDADDLLVVRCIERMERVKLDPYPRVVLPFGAEQQWQGLAGSMQ